MRQRGGTGGLVMIGLGVSLAATGRKDLTRAMTWPAVKLLRSPFD